MPAEFSDVECIKHHNVDKMIEKLSPKGLTNVHIVGDDSYRTIEYRGVICWYAKGGFPYQARREEFVRYALSHGDYLFVPASQKAEEELTGEFGMELVDTEKGTKLYRYIKKAE